jgi:hypothetical protein
MSTRICRLGFMGLMLTWSLSVFAQSVDDDIQFQEDHRNATIIKDHQDANGDHETQIQQGKVKPRRGPRRVGEVYEDDRERVRARILSLKLWSFGFGPASAQNLSNSNMFYAFNFGRSWEVNEQAELRGTLYAAFASKDTGGFLMAGMGGSYFFSTSDISPLVGAELGFGTAYGPDATNGSGFAGELHAGVRFFRTAETQMSLEGYYRTIFANAAPSILGAALSLHF